MIKLSEALALALLVLALAIVFVSGRVLAAPDAKVKALAAEAAAGDEATIKRLQGEEARKLAEQQRVKAAQAKKEELLRRCKIKPVMSDGEIEACRVAYREVGEATKF
jgi:predicted Holliday junction resolvase-like endonuclease